MLIFFVIFLPTISWALKLECFERIRNHTLIGAVVVTLEDVSVQQCQHACLEAKNQGCRSFMYHNGRSRCFLNSEDKTTTESNFFSVLDPVDYYHRTCYNKPKKPLKSSLSTLRDSVFDDNCYETIKGKVLIGIVDQLIQGISSQAECLKRCQKSKDTSDIVCKSAVYYEKEKECVIASQSRIDIPDLFVEDEQGIYMENICLNDSGASMKKLKALSEANSGDSSKAGGTSTESTTTRESMESTTSSSLRDFSAPAPARAAQETKKSMSGGTVEQSGYDSPSDMIGDHSSIDALATHATTTSTTTEKLIMTINPKVIDSYNVDVGVKKTPIDAGYGKRLRDSRVKECFTEVRPLRPMQESRVTKAYSLEQCTDICRLCWRCLRGKKCLGVAFDISSELCALSTSHMVDGGDMQDLDGIVYHNRSDC
ncbi:hypothetical protein V3C99_013878 [Haemonchus contortus]